MKRKLRDIVINQFFLSGSQYSSEYQAILTKNNTLNNNYGKPSSSIKTAGNVFLTALKTHGILAKLDYLKVLGTNGSAKFSDIDWVNPANYQSVRTKTPKFIRNGGLKFYSGTDDINASSYLDLTWKPSDGVNFLQDACEQIIYYKNLPSTFSVSLADGVRNAGSGGSQHATAINPLYASLQALGNSNAGGLAEGSDAQFDATDGIYFWGRLNASTEFIKKGSGSRVTQANTSTGRSTFNDTIGGLNTAGTVAGFNSRQVILKASGGLLTTQNEADFKTDFEAYLAVLNADAALATIGNLYNKSSWTDLSDFTNNGSTCAVVANQLAFSLGAGTFTQTLDQAITYQSKLNKWSQTIRFVIGSIGPTTYGPGIGIRSTNTSQALSCSGRFVMTTGTGYLQLYGGAGMSAKGSASSNIASFSISDTIEMTMTVNGWVTTLSAYNVTTGSAVISCQTVDSSAISNTGKFCIYSTGGIFTVTQWTITSGEYYQPNLMMWGASKTLGYIATRQYYSFAYLFEDTYGPLTVRGGGSDRTAEFLLQLPEIINVIKPVKIYLDCLPSNDIRTSVPSGTWQANYTSIVSQLQATGILVYHNTGLYETGGVDQSPFQTWVKANYPAANIIDTLPTVLSLSDGVHPNDAGHATACAQIITAGIL